MKTFEYTVVSVPDYKPGSDLTSPGKPESKRPDDVPGLVFQRAKDGWELFAIRTVPKAGPLASKGEREANHEFWFKREVG